jgi:hypothetical protein
MLNTTCENHNRHRTFSLSELEFNTLYLLTDCKSGSIYNDSVGFVISPPGAPRFFCAVGHISGKLPENRTLIHSNVENRYELYEGSVTLQNAKP